MNLLIPDIKEKTQLSLSKTFLLEILKAKIDLFLKQSLGLWQKFVNDFWSSKTTRYRLAAALDLVLIMTILFNGFKPAQRLVSPFFANSLNKVKLFHFNGQLATKEAFAFAPGWVPDALNRIDFNGLSTLAYFDVPILPDGNLNQSSTGFQTFQAQAGDLVQKAHAFGTKVVLVATQGNNDTIKTFLDDTGAQNTFTKQIIQQVKDNNIDGVNLNIEYKGNP